MSTMFTNNGVHGWRNIALGGKRGMIQGVLKMNKDGIAWRSKGGQSVSVVGAELEEAVWIRISKSFQIRLKTKGGTIFKFDGFKEQDGDFLKNFFKDSFSIEMEEANLSTKGWNWGEFVIQDNSVSFYVGDEKSFDIPLTEVAQAGLTSAKSSEVALEFHQDDTTSETVESLVEMKLFFPNEGGDNTAAKEKAQQFLTRVLAKADIVSASGKGLITFHEVPVLTPRGRYEIEMFPSFMKMHGKTFDYKINYSNIVRLFQLPKPDGRHQMFVVSLEPPIRQGHTAYPHIVMQIPETDEVELKPNIPKELENDERMKQLQAIVTGGSKILYDLIARAFKCLSGKRITVPKTFKSKEGGAAVKCSLRANEGYLFPLERSFFFVHKPPTHIRFDEISSVDFLRVSDDSTNRTFDLGVNLTNGSSMQFKSLLREEYSPLFNFFTKKKIAILNLQDMPAGFTTYMDSDGEDDGDKKKRSSRAVVKDVRLRVRRAMQQEQIDSDESDQDFGFDEHNPEEEDVHIDSTEIDSASEIEEDQDGNKRKKTDKKPSPNPTPNPVVGGPLKRKKPDTKDGKEGPGGEVVEGSEKRARISLGEREPYPGTPNTVTPMDTLNK